MKIFRKLYDWGLKQAESPHAERALFWVAFVESSFFPLPPDVLLIAMVLSARNKWFRIFLLLAIVGIYFDSGYLLYYHSLYAEAASLSSFLLWFATLFYMLQGGKQVILC